MNLVFLGGPGAGKGTQAKELATEYSWAHISTGDLLRGALAAGTELGKKAEEHMSRGTLVPDNLMCDLVAERLGQDDCKEGWILDGFPRTHVQADALNKTLNAMEIELDAVLFFSIDEDVLVERLTGRLTCKNCGAIYHRKNMPPAVEGVCDSCKGPLYQRSDDNETAVRNRLEVYKNLTADLVAFYEDEDLLRRVAAEGTLEEVATRVAAALADS
ncbi:MAG: adenylate kinase [Planctomycetota bacterium]